MRRRDTLVQFALRFLLYFLLLTFLWIALGPLYAALIFTGANLVFQLDNPPVARVREFYAYRVTETGDVPVFAFERYGLFFNAVVLAALLMATPGLVWPSRLRRVALGMALLAVAHVLFVVFQVKASFVNMGLLSMSPPAAYAYNWLAVLFGTLGEGLFPLLIAGALSWKCWAKALGVKLLQK